MKIEISVLAGLFLGSQLLMVRAAVVGVEQALLTTAFEWVMAWIKSTGKTLL